MNRMEEGFVSSRADTGSLLLFVKPSSFLQEAEDLI